MATLYDFTAIREQVRAVMGQQEPRRLDWRTPPSLSEKHLGVGCEQSPANPQSAPRVSESSRPFPEPAA